MDGSSRNRHATKNVNMKECPQFFRLFRSYSIAFLWSCCALARFLSFRVKRRSAVGKEHLRRHEKPIKGTFVALFACSPSSTGDREEGERGREAGDRPGAEQWKMRRTDGRTEDASCCWSNVHGRSYRQNEAQSAQIGGRRRELFPRELWTRARNLGVP